MTECLLGFKAVTNFEIILKVSLKMVKSALAFSASQKPSIDFDMK